MHGRVDTSHAGAGRLTGILRAAAGISLVGGAYGATISLLHLVHNRTTSPVDAVMVLAVMLVLYTGWTVAVLIPCALLVSWWQRRSPPAALREDHPDAPSERATEQSEEPSGAIEVRAPLELPGLFLGLLVFHLMFWLPVFLYGITYEQTLVFRPRGFAGMLTWIVLAAGVVAALALGLSGLTQRFVTRVVDGSVRNRALVWVGVGALFVIHLAAPLLYRSAEASESARQVAAVADDALAAEARDFRVVLVGLDGADPEVIERLVGEGRLPTFERLIREGSWGPLTTLPDANSAVIWASIYTGATPEEHRVQDFYRIHLPGVEVPIYPVHRTFFKEFVGWLEKLGIARRSVITRAELARPPLWEIVDQTNVTWGIVDGYLYSFPAFEPRKATPGPLSPEFFVAYGADGWARQKSVGELSLDQLRWFVQPKELYPLLEEALPEPDFAWQSQSLLRLLARPVDPPQLVLALHARARLGPARDLEAASSPRSTRTPVMTAKRSPQCTSVSTLSSPNSSPSWGLIRP